MTVTTTPLTGSDLLTLVKEFGDAPKSELVRAAGYVSTKKDGSERLNFTAFYEALLNAKGVNFRETTRGDGQPGRRPTFNTRVQFNGNLMVGRCYTAQMGLKPGDQFKIKIHRGEIRLVPAHIAEEVPA